MMAGGLRPVKLPPGQRKSFKPKRQCKVLNKKSENIARKDIKSRRRGQMKLRKTIAKDIFEPKWLWCTARQRNALNRNWISLCYR